MANYESDQHVNRCAKRLKRDLLWWHWKAVVWAVLPPGAFDQLCSFCLLFVGANTMLWFVISRYIDRKQMSCCSEQGLWARRSNLAGRATSCDEGGGKGSNFYRSISVVNVTACCQVGAIFDRFESLAQEEKITLLGLFDPRQYKVSTVPKFAIIKFSWRDSEDKTLLEAIFMKNWFSGWGSGEWGKAETPADPVG